MKIDFYLFSLVTFFLLLFPPVVHKLVRPFSFKKKKNLIKRKENVSVIWFSSSLIYSPPPLSHCHRLGSVYSTNYITIYIYVAYIYYVAFDILLGNIRRLGTVFSFLRMINNNENQATQIGPLKIDLHFNFAFSNSPVTTSSSSVNLIKYNRWFMSLIDCFCLSFDSLFIGEWESKRIFHVAVLCDIIQLMYLYLLTKYNFQSGVVL